jgi:hypothetical protein
MANVTYIANMFAPKQMNKPKNLKITNFTGINLSKIVIKKYFPPEDMPIIINKSCKTKEVPKYNATASI